MKIVTAIDSFKGSMTSMEAVRAVAQGSHRADAGAEILVRPLADGGEGTVDAFLYALGGEKKSVWVSDAFNEQKILAHYAMLKDDIAVIEMAD